MTVESVIAQCEVQPGNVVKLPPQQLDRKLYQDVAAKLQGIGGAWKGGKIAGFVFPFDPTERLAQIQGGEIVNLKKDFQFFETPSDLADELVRLAEIRNTDTVLEPSAGRGAIIEAIRRSNEHCYIDAFELMPENVSILKSKCSNLTANPSHLWFSVWQADFLEQVDFERNQNHYDRIIANPPFTKNQDIDHVMAMWKCLKPGGRIVSIMSKHWQQSNNKKETDFRLFIAETNAEVIEVGAGTFAESGTKIASLIVVIDK